MIWLGRNLLIWATAAVITLGASVRSEAAMPPAWQADPVFSLDPDQVPGNTAGASRIVYLVRDPEGEPVPKYWWEAAHPLHSIEVPPIPGIYTIEGRLEDAKGRELRRATTSAYFDNEMPPPPLPRAPDRWLLGRESAVLTIDDPTETLPLSGLRGYAVSLDAGEGSSPCAGTVCSEAEVDVAGAGDSSLSLGTLPQGTTYARVAAVSGASVPSPVRTVVFRVDGTPPVLSLRGATTGWSSGPVKVTALAEDQLSGMVAAGPLGPTTAIAVDGAAAIAAPGDTVSAWVSGSGMHRVEPMARDAAGNISGLPGAPASHASVRIDEGAPRVVFATAQDPGEPERIEAFVSDLFSGPSPSRGSIAVRLSGTRARFEELPTRVEAGRLVARWDSDSYPPGKYEFLATGFDVAGNAAAGTDRARGGRMVLVNPLKTAVWLGARLADGRFGGRLLRVGGGVVPHQRIAVVETFAAGAEPRTRTSFRHTDGEGAFSIRLEPGPSRDVAAVFAGTSLLTRARSDIAHLGVPTRVQLRSSGAVATVSGAPIVFSGSVRALGAHRAVRGLPVELQFRYPGGGWRGFRTVEANRRGRFRYAYRFSDDDSRGVRFRFRAYVKGREGWPYEPSASRPVLVTGR